MTPQQRIQAWAGIDPVILILVAVGALLSGEAGRIISEIGAAYAVLIGTLAWLAQARTGLLARRYLAARRVFGGKIDFATAGLELFHLRAILAADSTYQRYMPDAYTVLHAVSGALTLAALYLSGHTTAAWFYLAAHYLAFYWEPDVQAALIAAREDAYKPSHPGGA